MRRFLALLALAICLTAPASQAGMLQAIVNASGAAPFTPTSISNLSLWLEGDVGVYKDAGTTLAVNNDTVQQWNDQSGNANNCTQASAGNRPAYKTGIINSKPTVRGDGTGASLTCPNIYPTGTSSLTMFIVNKQANSTGQQTLVGDAAGGSADHALYFNGSDIVYYNGSQNQLTAAGIAAATPSLYQLNIVGRTNTLFGTTQAVNLYANQTYNLQIQGTSVNTVNTMTLFSHAGTLFSSGDIAEVLLYAKTLNITETNNVINYLNTKYALGLSLWPTDKQVICDGDSITQGFSSSTSPPWCQLLQAHEGRFALSLGTLSGEALDLTSQGATVVDPLYSAAVTKNIVVWWAGTNDIVSGGRTGAQVYADFQTYCADRHTKGWKVVAVPMMPRSAGTEAERTSLNNSLASDGCADAKVLVGCDANMWAAGANTNLTYFNADQIHPNATGHASLEACIAPAVDSI